MSNPNYEYIRQNYKLPEWFIHNDIDWVRYYPMRGGNIIYDDVESIAIHKIFVKYLTYINDMELKKDITDEEIDKLLNIKVCDYDWLFMWSNPTYDKDSKELLLQRL
jgi:hypothetical protein